MRYLPLVVFGAVAAFASGASAQSINLTGTYRCIQDCRDGNLGAPAFVTQNGDQLNLVTETGESYRAWPDVTAPKPGSGSTRATRAPSIRRTEYGFSSTTAGSGSGIRTTSASR